jgi:hypothetical protein
MRMSAPRSKIQKVSKRYGDQVRRYQQRIDRQADSIGRLTKAMLVYGDALTKVAEDVTNVKDARKAAKEALDDV